MNGQLQPSRVSALVSFTWLSIVLVLATVTAAPHASRLLFLAQASPEYLYGLVVVMVVVGLPVIGMLALGILPRPYGRLAMLAFSGAAVPVILGTSGVASAGAVVLATLIPPCVIGRVAVRSWLRSTPRCEAWVIGSALGLGSLALLTLGLGRIGQIGAHTIWPLTIATSAVALGIGHTVLRQDLSSVITFLRADEKVGWVTRIQFGLTIGAGWLTLVSAVTPEISTDPVAVRLPVAAYVAASGRASTNPDFLVALAPGASELIYAFVLSVGPLEATKLVSLFVGWLSILGVGALAWRLGGRRAVLPATLTFATLPLMLRTLESASADVFAVLYAVAASLMLARADPVRLGSASIWAACVLLGMSVKASFATVAGGLVVAAPLCFSAYGSARRTLRMAAMLGPVLAVLLLMLAAMNLSTISQALSVLPVGSYSKASIDTQLSGFERPGAEAQNPVWALLTSPVIVTIRTTQYRGEHDGAIGYLLLALIPLALLTRPTAPTLRMLVVVVVSYLIWFWSTQYLRYMLPLTALLSALGGLAFSRDAPFGVGRLRAAVGALLPLIAVLGIVSYLSIALLGPGGPWRVALGLQDRAASLEQIFPSFHAIQLLNAEPERMRVATNFHGLPQIYTTTPLNAIFDPSFRLRGVVPLDAMHNEEAMLRYLDAARYSHILLHGTMSGNWWIDNVASDGEFLRRNTVLVGGARSTYLYRVLPPELRGNSESWTRGPELLPNTGFEVEADGTPVSWKPVGSPVQFDVSGQWSRDGRGAVRVSSAGAYSAVVPVTAGTEYLLAYFARAAGEFAWARADITWIDASGGSISRSSELAPSSGSGYHEWWMAATAPPTAISAAVNFFSVGQSDVWFDDVSLRARQEP